MWVVSTAGFESLDVLGLTFKVQLLKVGLPDVELNP